MRTQTKHKQNTHKAQAKHKQSFKQNRNKTQT